MAEQTRILTANFGAPSQTRLESALLNGAYCSLDKAIKTRSPEQVIELIDTSGLRGRGGAGFPAGVKWGLARKQPEPRILCCNADEGEPGTFKDRTIIENDPHLLLEGIAICCYAVGIRDAYVYIRGEFARGAEILQTAIDEATDRGFLGPGVLGTDFSCNVSIHRGGGSYICGEETALIASLEGRRGLPRIKPPYPVSDGAFHRATVVNNVETLANVPRIVARGADWFASIGAKNEPGTRLFSVSGQVNAPGVYELPVGTPLCDLLELAGGVRKGNRLKAVIPGGCSTPVVLPQDIGVALDIDSLKSIGSAAGTGAVIVIDETTCLVKTARRILGFYRHECCGQCSPGRIGVGYMADVLRDIENMKGNEGSLRQLVRSAEFVQKTALCELGKSSPGFLISTLRHFQEEYEAHAIGKRCPTGRCSVGA